MPREHGAILYCKLDLLIYPSIYKFYLTTSNNSKCEMQQIKGINMEHILCPPCRYKMGITNQFIEYDSGQMFESLSKTSKHGLECNVSI
jgi:hypothetical protein